MRGRIQGWFAVRREMKLAMGLFLALCFTYIAAWSVMFASQVYRFTFLQWEFFSSVTVVSFLVLISTGIFGVLCRINFGRGLAHYRECYLRSPPSCTFVKEDAPGHRYSAR